MSYENIEKGSPFPNQETGLVFNEDGIELMKRLLVEKGKGSIDLILCDLPYSFEGRRITANSWDTPIDIDEFFDLATQLIKETGVICLTATQPFTSYLVQKGLRWFKYEWIWEKDNGSNFVHVKHQPFRVHESVLVFGKAPTTYNKKGLYMTYNPQFSEGKPYVMKRKGCLTSNLATSKGYKRTDSKSEGKRYPRSVQKFNLERGLHPTQKPTELFSFLIKTYSEEGDCVLDICCGSGTTAISCLRTKRKFIVNDLTPVYYQTTKRRIEEEIKLSQTDLG